MKPFRGITNKSISNRKYGVEGLTEIENESEGAIMRSESNMGTTAATSSPNR
jgi:hypothetical protein